MATKISTFFDLSLTIKKIKLDDEFYKISATSQNLRKEATARLSDSKVDELKPSAIRLKQNELSLNEIQGYGRQLFEALIRDQVRDMYRTVQGENVDGFNFQLVLDLREHSLQRLPWECMFDPFREEFLSLQPNTHIIRKVKLESGGVPSKTDRAFTNLIIAIANPKDMSPINSKEEKELIENAIGDLHRLKKINRRFIPGSQKEISEALSNVPDVFHFVGHGGINRSDTPGLYLEEQNGDGIFVTAEKLEKDYFTPPTSTDRRIRLVILSACQTSETPRTEGYNSVAHQLVRQVDAVVAMQFPISLSNLSVFNFELYHSLAQGDHLETAINKARRKIYNDKLRGVRDWLSPVLVSRQLVSIQLVSRNPFMGPKYYDFSDRERFSSREIELEKLDKLNQNQNITIIKGVSGCGKTSLLKAGLMANLTITKQPLIYLSLSEDLANQLRIEIDKLLTKDEKPPLPESEIEKLTDQFPKDLAIILDRAEQIEHLGEQISRVVKALINWANDSQKELRRSSLVIATRLNEKSKEPALLQQWVPEMEYPRLHLKMLDYNSAMNWIKDTTRKSNVIFSSDTTNAILFGLKYEQQEYRNMVALQVVCEAVYQHAYDLNREEAKPELLTDLHNAEGILKERFSIPEKYTNNNEEELNKIEKGAREVLSQFVASDGLSMRPRSWDDLISKCRLEDQELKQILFQLEEERLLRLEPRSGGEKYELVHETLVPQINWLDESEIDLRKLEEIIESAHTLIPLGGESGLKKLDSRRDELILTVEQHKLLLLSALEYNHEVDYWFKRLEKESPDEALPILTSKYLSEEAQERACPYLGVLGAKEGETAQAAKENLWELAAKNASPRVRQAASLALAPLMDETFLNQKFWGESDDFNYRVEALAIMFDSRWLPLKGLTAAARRQIRIKLLKINAVEIIFNAARAALLGALGFALAVVWIYAQAYRSLAVENLPPAAILILEFSLVGLLAFILALPGALCVPIGRDISAILSGGRRKLPAAIGTIAGSALGTGLTVLVLAALAEYRDPSLVHLFRYFVSGAVFGGVIGLPWLLPQRSRLIRTGLILLVGFCGALAFLGVSMWEGWWPEASFALTLDARYGWAIRAVPGILIGLGSAIGLSWGRLRNQSQ